jgi:diguanylate cyclase (GGDEF)-like protein
MLMALLSVPPYASAQSSTSWDRLATPLVAHLDHRQGMPEGAGIALARDRDGFIWIGSDGGLARWDGYTMRVFRHKQDDPHSLPNTLIRRLMVDGAGQLWALMVNGGVARYDATIDGFHEYPSEPTGIGRLLGFAMDGKGGLWIDAINGVSRLDLATGIWQRQDTGLLDKPTDYNNGFIAGRDGSLWFARGARLARWRNGTVDFVALPQTTEDLPASAWAVTALTETSDGLIWYGTYGGHIGQVDPMMMSAHLIPQAAQQGSQTSAIIELPSGSLCFAFQESGGATIYRPGSDHTIRLTSANGLADDDARSLVADPSGLLFVGTIRGVDIFAPSERAVVTLGYRPEANNGLSEADVTKILPRSDGTVWFGLRKRGIDVFRPDIGRIRFIPMANDRRAGAGANRFYSMADDTDGTVMGSSERGIVRVNPGGTEMQLYEGSIERGIAILITESGKWVGTKERGVEKVDDKGHVLMGYSNNPSDPDSLADSFVLALMNADATHIWVCMAHGLDLLDVTTGKARHFRHDPNDPTSLPDYQVWSVLRDSFGKVWVGTGGNGIGVLDLTSSQDHPIFHQIGLAQGLPNANIDSLLRDGRGRIWASTDDGIAVLDEATMKVERTLTPADGKVITNYWQGSDALLPDGTLMFGGEGGVSIIHPERLTDWTYKPPVRVTEIKVGGQAQAPNAPIVLTPTARRVEVEFAALDYSAPQENKYEYRLEGYDSDWITTGADRRVALYQNLPPGSYRLLLRGSNRAGMWVDPLILPITVLPAWYQTIWCEIAEFLGVLLLIYGAVQLRTSALRQRRVQLEREVAERTQQLAITAETLRLANAELDRLAHHDPLTGLGNRRRFLQMADELIALARRHGRPCSVLMVDLDHFKRINDTHGHAAGDETLRAVARCLVGSLREIDIVARFGGEEMAAFLPETDLADACLAAERFRQALENLEIHHESTLIRVTASIGVASWVETESAIEPALERADIALYRVKQGGRNGVAAEPPLAPSLWIPGSEAGQDITPN